MSRIVWFALCGGSLGHLDYARGDGSGEIFFCDKDRFLDYALTRALEMTPFYNA